MELYREMDDLRTLFIHIGPHKTGATTIQHGLGLNEKILRRKGVLIPKSGRPFPKNGGVHNLAWQLVEHKKTPITLNMAHG